MHDPERTSTSRMSVLVSGAVQGVGYRAYARRHALDLALTGYAENLGDGRVEVVVEGDRRELEQLLHLLRRGPAHAHVDAIEVAWGEGGGLAGFFTY